MYGMSGVCETKFCYVSERMFMCTLCYREPLCFTCMLLYLSPHSDPFDCITTSFFHQLTLLTPSSHNVSPTNLSPSPSTAVVTVPPDSHRLAPERDTSTTQVACKAVLLLRAFKSVRTPLVLSMTSPHMCQSTSLEWEM